MHGIMWAFISVLLCTACTGNTDSRQADISAPPQVVALGKFGDTCRVYKVVDGDTFWGETTDSRKIKVRLIGVDAPETRNTANKEASPFGIPSKKFLYALIYNETVVLKYDVDKTDRWGRALAYVYLTDGSFVNAEMVRSGNAVVMTVPPNVRYAEMFLSLQQKARGQKKGMWAE